MRRFEMVQSTTETTTSHAGLALVGRALAMSGPRQGTSPDPAAPRHRARRLRQELRRPLVHGKKRFRRHREQAQRHFLHYRTWHRAGAVGAEPQAALRRARRGHDPPRRCRLDGLIAATQAPVTPIVLRYGTRLSAKKRKYVALDIDVFPMDNSGTKKEWRQLHLQGFRRLRAARGLSWRGRLVSRLRAQARKPARAEGVRLFSRAGRAARLSASRGTGSSVGSIPATMRPRAAPGSRPKALISSSNGTRASRISRPGSSARRSTPSGAPRARASASASSRRRSRRRSAASTGSFRRVVRVTERTSRPAWAALARAPDHGRGLVDDVGRGRVS